MIGAYQPLPLFNEQNKVCLGAHQALRRRRAIEVSRDQLLDLARLQPDVAPEPGDVAIEENQIAVNRSLRTEASCSMVRDGLRFLGQAVALLEPLLDCRQPFAAAGRPPIGHQRGQRLAHRHQPERSVRRVQVTADLVMHGLFDAHHLGPQDRNLAADLINSVVHGLLEQKENIESSYRCRQGDGK
jgi:hypothetical protein